MLRHRINQVKWRPFGERLAGEFGVAPHKPFDGV